MARLLAFIWNDYMENINLQEFIGAVGGSFLLGDPHTAVRVISIDTRTLRRGDFYFAIKGPQFDGHDFLKQAIEKQAGGLVISRKDIDLGNPFPAFPAMIQVNDTTQALGDIAAFYRKKWSIPVVGITGSNGKTTTKEMLASILRQSAPTLSTVGNLNNLIGVPLTLLQLSSNHRYAVVEMGSSLFGEIKKLAAISRPTIGIITNIGYTHLENFINLEGVLAGKKALLDALPEEGCAVINADDLHLSKLTTQLHCAVRTFSLYKGADAYAEYIQLWPDKPSFELNIQGKKIKILMPVYGKFNIYNALAAAAAAGWMGIDIETIKKGLEHFISPGMRMETHTLKNGALVINDAYNANPSSIKESVQGMITAFPERPKIVVLGDMLELGTDAAKYHAKLGEFLAMQPLEKIFLFGPLMEAAANRLDPSLVRHFMHPGELEIELKKTLASDVVVLFKGSRGMHLEEIFRRVTGE